MIRKDETIFVAGGTGMVGAAIIQRLAGEGYTSIVSNYHNRKPASGLPSSVTFFPLDLTRQREIEQFFESARPQHVYLAAARVGGILANETYPAQFIYDNIMIASNVINAAYRSGAVKLLNLGSSCIYPKFAPQPMKEEYLLTGVLEPTNEAYAIAKIAAIKLCRYFNEQYGTNFLSVMPANLYGSYDNFNLETAHVLPALIRKFHLAKLLRQRNFDALIKDLTAFPLGFGVDCSGMAGSDRLIRDTLARLGITEEYVLLWGSGEPYREFLHADDLADACLFLMEHYDHKDTGEFINIGTGEERKVKELAQLTGQIVGFDGEIRHDVSKKDGMPRKLLDVSRMKRLGWQAKTALDVGVREAYTWYTDFVEGGLGKHE